MKNLWRCWSVFFFVPCGCTVTMGVYAENAHPERDQVRAKAKIELRHEIMPKGKCDEIR